MNQILKISPSRFFPGMDVQVLLPGTYVRDARARGAIGPSEAHRISGPAGRPTTYIVHASLDRIREIKTDASSRSLIKGSAFDGARSIKRSAQRAFDVLATRIERLDRLSSRPIANTF